MKEKKQIFKVIMFFYSKKMIQIVYLNSFNDLYCSIVVLKDHVSIISENVAHKTPIGSVHFTSFKFIVLNNIII